MSIVLIDTSVFCNILPVPGLDQHRAEVMQEMESLIQDAATLLLPMASVLETGNHIAQLTNGQNRRRAALRFCRQVQDAIDGTAPWTPTPFWDLERLKLWLPEFPDHAMGQRGMGDLSIIKEWERQCALHKARRVRIWARDGHLDGFDRTL